LTTVLDTEETEITEVAHYKVLDPFCGTGTTVVECQKLGIPAVGLEANPVACFASQTKLRWDISPQQLLAPFQSRWSQVSVEFDVTMAFLSLMRASKGATCHFDSTAASIVLNEFRQLI
jgi:hypothetical protein